MLFISFFVEKIIKKTIRFKQELLEERAERGGRRAAEEVEQGRDCRRGTTFRVLEKV